MLSDSEKANYRSMDRAQLLARREHLDTILHHLTPLQRSAHRAFIAEELLIKGSRS